MSDIASIRQQRVARVHQSDDQQLVLDLMRKQLAQYIANLNADVSLADAETADDSFSHAETADDPLSDAETADDSLSDADDPLSDADDLLSDADTVVDLTLDSD